MAGARALSHSALESAYGKDKPRPKVFAERKFFSRKPVKGRGRFGAATGLLAVSIPPAAVGLNNLMHPKEVAAKADTRKRNRQGRSLYGQTKHGVVSSLRQRNKTMAEHAPAKQLAQNNGIGTLIGSAAGGLAGQALKHTPLGGKTKAGIIGVSGIAAGVASMPAQARLMRHTSHGQYTVTPTGVSRVKRKPVPASAKANRVERQHGIEVPARLNKALVLRDPQRRLPRADPKKVQEAIARLRSSKGKPERWVAKFDQHYPGSDMTHGQKRAIVMASGTTPFIGDVAAGTAAARMAPPNLRKKTAALQMSGSLGGSAVGAAAGAYGGSALVRHNKTANNAAVRIKHIADKVHEGVVSRVAPKHGAKLKASREHRESGKHVPDTSRITRMASHKRPGVARAGRALVRARRPLLGAGAVGAALGTMAGQSLGSTTGSTLTYGHALHLEDKQRGHKIARSKDNRHGSRVAKLDSGNRLSPTQERKQLRQKHHAAVVGEAASITGLAGLGLLSASAMPKVPKKIRSHLLRASVGTSVVSGGLGGTAGILGSRYARRDIKARESVIAAKALMPRMPNPARIAPVKASVPRAGTLVRTRNAAGVTNTTTRRGVI